jgi:hypothetical protein
MHIEKNVCSSMLHIMMNDKSTKKDGLHVRKELVNQNRMPYLHPRRNGKWKKGPWKWSPVNKIKVLDRIVAMKPPTGFGANLSKCMKKEKMSGLKSHDYHNILQYLLPIAVKGTLTRTIEHAVQRLAGVLRWICQKEIPTSELNAMEIEIAETMCMFEMCMSPTFFDGQVHLLVHLVEEVRLAGPVHYRWMYFLERYMKELKGHVRQMAHPEGSMATGYASAEAAFYCTELLKEIDPMAPLVRKLQLNQRDEGLELPKRSIQRKMSMATISQVSPYYH